MNGQKKGMAVLNTLNANEINMSYGGEHFQYITRTEQETTFADYELEAFYYNELMPHYQYSYCLLCPPEDFANVYDDDFYTTPSFLTYTGNPHMSFELTHNLMHTYSSFPMNNNDFSISNPLFYVFHTHIDYMIELKIRMIREDYRFTNSQHNLVRDEEDTRTDNQKAVDSLTSFLNQLMDPDYAPDIAMGDINPGKVIFMTGIIDYYG